MNLRLELHPNRAERISGISCCAINSNRVSKVLLTFIRPKNK